MDSRPGQLSSMMRTLGRQLKDKLSAALGFNIQMPPKPPPRVSVVEKVSRNALAELIGRARSHPQRGSESTGNPAYTALAELTKESGRPGLALGLRFDSGEISFLDLDLDADAVEESGGAFVSRADNILLWRRLEEMIYQQVDRTMVGPRKPIKPPEEVDL